MFIDCRIHKLCTLFLVMDEDTNKEIEEVIYADDKKGIYGIYLKKDGKHVISEDKLTIIEKQGNILLQLRDS